MGGKMSGPKNRVTTADTEAAEWHARLGEQSVATQTIEDFFAWHQHPEHAAAYRRVQTIWGQSPRLAGRPGMVAALEAARSRRETTGRDRRLPRSLLGLVAAASLGVLAFGGFAWLEARSVYSTETGEQRVVQLADGSTVRLDTASRIRVRLSADRRDVDLEAGQALFTVAHDRRRPFVVRAGQSTVTAVGTVFEVARRGAEADVVLVEGVVDVRPTAGSARPVRMTAGEQASVRGAVAAVARVNVANETSWTQGQIVLRDTPLREGVAQVNRYLTDKIELDAPGLEATPINGVFKTGDRDAFVAMASGALGLEVSGVQGGGVRLSERGK
jgi:transmembrane sensor